MVTSKASQNEIDKTISVIMAVYNTEKFLSEAIESILDQTCSDFELIIIDDASTDNSLEIIRHYEKLDSRIKVIENESNLGISKSRNEGLAAASGKLVANVDSDDISFSDRFEKQINYFTQFPDTLVLGGQLEKIDSNGNPLESKWYNAETIYRWDALTRKSSVPHVCMMVRRDYLVSVGGYPEGYQNSIDRALFLKMALSQDFCMRNLPSPLVKYRIHPGSTSVNNRNLQISNTYQIIKQALETLIQSEIPKDIFDIICGCAEEEPGPQRARKSFRTFEKILKAYKETYKPDPIDWSYTKKDFVRRAYRIISPYRFRNVLSIIKLFILHPKYFT